LSVRNANIVFSKITDELRTFSFEFRKFGATHRQVLPKTNKAPQAVACEAYSLALQDGLEPTTP
jgi:hypothetical protein